MQKHIDKMIEQMDKTMEYLISELGKVRTGRAQTSMLDSVVVEAYGAMTPLNQVALITTPDAHQILVKPFDPSLIGEIDQAISRANLGINPTNDGESVRVLVPSLTEETRKVIAKEVKAVGEQTKIKIRNARHDGISSAKKDSELTEDLIKSAETKIQNKTNEYNKKIEDAIKLKEQEVLTI